MNTSFIVKFYALFVCALSIVLAAFYLNMNYTFYWNKSHSLPQKLFIVSKKTPTQFESGQLVAFHHAVTKDVIIKRIAGIEGDSIEHLDRAIRVNNTDYHLLEHDSKETKLLPMTQMIVLPKTLFVVGDDHKSFDSRYEKFGLIHHQMIRGRAWSIF